MMVAGSPILSPEQFAQSRWALNVGAAVPSSVDHLGSLDEMFAVFTEDPEAFLRPPYTNPYESWCVEDLHAAARLPSDSSQCSRPSARGMSRSLEVRPGFRGLWAVLWRRTHNLLALTHEKRAVALYLWARETSILLRPALALLFHQASASNKLLKQPAAPRRDLRRSPSRGEVPRARSSSPGTASVSGCDRSWTAVRCAGETQWVRLRIRRIRHRIPSNAGVAESQWLTCSLSSC